MVIEGSRVAWGRNNFGVNPGHATFSGSGTSALDNAFTHPFSESAETVDWLTTFGAEIESGTEEVIVRWYDARIERAREATNRIRGVLSLIPGVIALYALRDFETPAVHVRVDLAAPDFDTEQTVLERFYEVYDAFVDVQLDVELTYVIAAPPAAAQHAPEWLVLYHRVAEA